MKIKKYTTIIIIIGGLLVGSSAGLWLSRGRSLSLLANTESIRNLTKASAGAEPAHIKGSENAVVTIEEFGDFQCPPCANLHPELKKLEKEYDEKLRVIFRHYPLEIHEQAIEAAEAAEAAALQGKFWEMHDLLYERQAEWSENANARQIFTEFAKSLNLDVEKFLKDMDTPETKSRIQSDKERGDSVEVSGTPTIFINGSEVLSESMTPESIKALINKAIL